MLTKSRLIQLFFMLCVLIGLFIWRTIDFTLSDDMNLAVDKEVKEVVVNFEDNTCDFSKPCLFNSAWGTFSLSVDEGKITPEEWFHLTLKSDLKNWKVISAKTIGKTMFMGKIPMKFMPVVQVGEKYQTNAKSMLGSCIEKRMVWRFDIEIDFDGQPINIFYDFVILH